MRQVLNLQVLQHVVNVDTITKDKVSVKVAVAVQYEVIAGKEAEAVYKLSRPETQIETYVFDVVRSLVTTQDLDEVFNSKGTIAEAVNRELTEDMKGFGYSIVKALVTEIDPDAKVKEAMNNINAAQRDAQPPTPRVKPRRPCASRPPKPSATPTSSRAKASRSSAWPSSTVWHSRSKT
ncbi:MAG: hypothetical protein IPP57_09140 [Candidatus Obscuribacter sp.]|nr:hypothetical protein [Candidatus Obscuribacter sp.]